MIMKLYFIDTVFIVAIPICVYVNCKVYLLKSLISSLTSIKIDNILYAAGFYIKISRIYESKSLQSNTREELMQRINTFAKIKQNEEEIGNTIDSICFRC